MSSYATAIDKFHTEEVKSSKTATTVPSQDKNELKVDESRDDDATSDSLGRQDFVVRDRLYVTCLYLAHHCFNPSTRS